MGFFGVSQDDTVTDEVESATSEKNVEEDWGIIINICDKAGKSSEEAKNYLRAIVKRLYNTDPHIGVKAVTLLDACVKNSGKTFHIEVASRDFENDFMKLMNKGHATVAKKLRESLKRWAENEFKSDGQLNLIPSLYSKLKNEGLDFSTTEVPVKKAAPQTKDPNFVDSQEEEEQILKAIELSLKDSGGSPRSAPVVASHTTSLYPSVNMATGSVVGGGTAPPKEPRKVRALYDFEAAEDNELTFNSGEIIFVTDDTDPNWWKGSNQRGEGLFPANFVTADLSLEPETFLYEKAKKMVQFKETADVKVVKEEPEEVEINEDKINRLLHLLHEADPTNPERDTDEMLNLEREVNNMGPLIDSELERVDRKHAQLTQLSADLVEALGLYHTLMREPPFPVVNKMPYGFPTTSQPMQFNGSLPQMVMIGGPHQQQQQPPPQHHEAAMFAGHHPHHQHHPHPGNPPPAPGMSYQMVPEQQQQPAQGMVQYSVPGLPNFGPAPGVLPPQFPPSGPVTQNGPPSQGQPHYVSSSTHMTH